MAEFSPLIRTIQGQHTNPEPNRISIFSIRGISTSVALKSAAVRAVISIDE
jgi:hypothetical protein